MLYFILQHALMALLTVLCSDEPTPEARVVYLYRMLGRRSALLGVI